MKITLLEDEFSLRDNIKDFLEFNGYEVESYGDGATLLEKTNFDSDLYMLDINVPGASGYEVIQWISNNTPDAPVIFITAYTDIQSVIKGYNLGCSDYLKKPFDLRELLFRITNILNGRVVGSVNITSEFKFDTRSRHLLKGNEVIKLSKIHKNILYTLVKYHNKIVNYSTIIDYVWEGKFIKNNIIASHIKDIKQEIPNIKIECIRSEGYILKLPDSA